MKDKQPQTPSASANQTREVLRPLDSGASGFGGNGPSQSRTVSSSPIYLLGPTVQTAATVPAQAFSADKNPAMKPVPRKRKNGKAAAIDVAKYLVYLASCEEEPDLLSHLRLQKLLYYVQGWSLALRNKPMFGERIEAWAHGPVVREVYATLATYGRGPILPECVGMPENLTQDEFSFIGSVWASYKKFSATSLREMTHKESPWIDARADFGPADRCENEITLQALKSFFSKDAV